MLKILPGKVREHGLLFLVFIMAIAPPLRAQQSQQFGQTPEETTTPQDQQNAAPKSAASGGKTELSSKQGNNLPLNGRDFS